MAKNWATEWVNQAREGYGLRLDPCHLPQRVAYVTQQSGLSLTCFLNERNIVLRQNSEQSNSEILRVLHSREFRAIAARRVATQTGQYAVALILLHENADYCVPLLISHNRDDILLDWRLWSDIYDLPMVSIDDKGAVTPVRECSPLQHFFSTPDTPTRSRFLLRCRGHSLNVRLTIANQVMLG